MEEEKTKTNLTTYTYLYNCQRWWGVVSGVRNLAHDGEETDVIKKATDIAENLTGSQTCDVSLLQKFQMSVQLSEPYPALVQFPLSTAETK
jgi:hypothetical protein